MSETLSLDGSPSFIYGAHCEIQVACYTRAMLSVPALDQGERLESKDLLASGKVSEGGKYTLEEHLGYLKAQDSMTPDRPLLVLGLRNNLVNLRTPIIRQGRVFAVEGEEPLRSQRPYYGIGYRNGQLVCDTALGGAGKPEDWSEFFCAGIPVLWDELDNESLLGLMLCEAADHSHVYDLPRGAHPAATEYTKQAWLQLHNVFNKHLYADQETAAGAMQDEVVRFVPSLRRCDNYFHAILGSRDDGTVVCLFAHGRLENLGRLMARHGCRRAICVENSGSIMPTFLPGGLAGEVIPLVHAPNFRPRGRTLLVIELASAAFDSFPLSAEHAPSPVI
jgi:hypothetical protein